MTTTTDLLKQIGMTVTEAGKGGLEKAKVLRDSALISLEIRDREASIRKAYRDLGKAYYQDHRNDEEPVYDQIEFIRAAFEEIGELKAAKDEIRGIRRCPCCGAPIQSDANFCPNCGKKYDDAEKAAAAEEKYAESAGEDVKASGAKDKAESEE